MWVRRWLECLSKGDTEMTGIEGFILGVLIGVAIMLIVIGVTNDI